MLIPAALVGSTRRVAEACERIAGLWALGARLDEAIGPMTESADQPGLHLLDRVGIKHLKERHVHHYALLQAMRQRITVEPALHAREREVLEDASRTPWGTLQIVAYGSRDWWSTEGRPRSKLFPMLLGAAARHWAELDAEGPRFTDGLWPAARLWSTPTMVHIALGHLGVTPAQLAEPLPPGGLVDLLPGGRGLDEIAREPRSSGSRTDDVG